MSKPKIDPQSVIYCGDRDDAYLAYISMFRYAFGRMTYMPGVVIGIIKRNEKYLSDRTLVQIDCELTEEAARYERVYANREHPNHGSNYGMERDRQAWLAFHEWVKEQINKRKEGAE